MSFPSAPQLENAKIESLQTQYEYLKLLRRRHLQWMNSTKDRRVRQTHVEIADLIEQVIGDYNHLLGLPPGQQDAE